jgi:CheY-like chemotaxis protein
MRSDDRTAAARPRSRDRPLDILIVEDHVDARETLAALLENWGCRVTVVAEGRAGVNEIRARRFDIVFCDLGLPDLDGLDVCREVRSTIERAPLMVALTAWGREDDRRRARDAGFDLHLVKPAAAANLIEILNRITD